MGNLLACLGAAKRERSGDTSKHSPSARKWYGRYKPVGESPTPRKLVSLLAADNSGVERSDAGERAAADADLTSESSSPQSNSKASRPLISNSPKKKVTFDLNVTTFDHVVASRDTVTSEEETEGVKLDLEQDEKSGTKEGTTSSVPRGCSGNNRYQNCLDESDDDFSEDDSSDYSEEEDVIDYDLGAQSRVLRSGLCEESFDSYFSLQVDEEHQGSISVNNAEVNSVRDSYQQTTVMHDQSGQHRNTCTVSAWSPVDNQLHRQETKGAEMTALHADKENMGVTTEAKLFFTPEHSIHSAISLDSTQKSYATAKHEFSVDSSLSCWLTPAYPVPVKESEAKSSSPGNNFRTNSSYGADDRPILGALTVDDLKRTVSPSPRKSPRSPDETPILGIVGSYWNPTNQEAESRPVRSSSAAKGIPNTTSKYREDKQVNWHTTPFEVRLEKALSKQTA